MTFTHGASAYRNGYCRCDVCCAANTARTATERAARRARLADDPDVEHGSHHTYSNWGCRCEACTAAQMVYNRASYADRKARLAADPTIVEHGRAVTYLGWGCRCDACRAAHTEAARRRRATPH